MISSPSLETTARTSAAGPTRPTVGIVIPALNEGPRLGKVLDSVPDSLPGIEHVFVVVVDDGSDDDTEIVARSKGAVVVRHLVNLGVGCALKTGTESAIAHGADLIVHIDADGQHPPEDIERLINPLLNGAYASSAARSFEKPMPALLVFGNHFLSTAARLIFGIRHPDTQCAYRAFRKEVWPHLRWTASDYAFATEMLVRARRRGIEWAIVPIATIYHDRYKGTGIGDGISIITRLLTWRFSPPALELRP